MEFVLYRSPWGDFDCSVPKGWTEETSADRDAYRFVSWTGPADRDALWGAPRFVVTWQAAGREFRKASGAKGLYDSIEDYIAQMRAQAWGPDPRMPEPLHGVSVGGRRARRMTIRVQKDSYMSLPGAKPVSQGGGRMWRRDTAVFVPTRLGFYAIVFPCAEGTFGAYSPAFERFLSGLRFLKDGPVE